MLSAGKETCPPVLQGLWVPVDLLRSTLNSSKLHHDPGYSSCVISMTHELLSLLKLF